MYLAKIHVMLKAGVLDPQGSTVKKALHALDFQGVEDVRIGKLMEVKFEARDQEDAQKQVDEMCEKLLANPVIEEYSFEIQEGS